ncbi:MAG: hypothetical protein ACK5KR_01410 [Breznakia sp.]
MIAFIVFNVTSCSQRISNEEKAEEFLKIVLTAPDKEISNLVNSNLAQENKKEFNSKMNGALQKLCEDYVSESKSSDASSQLIQNILMYHSMASMNGEKYIVKEVKITTSGNDNNFSYEASIESDLDDESFIIKGNIQFDDDGYIDYLIIPFENTPTLQNV